MKRWQLLFTALLLTGLLLVGCTSTPQSPAAAPAESNQTVQVSLPDTPKNGDGYTDITVEQLALTLDGKNFTLVNVHIPYDGELPKTDLFIPFDQMAANFDKLPDKNAPIVLYCRSGNMSTQAATQLAAAGYTQIYELDGGTSAWQAAGYTLLSK